MLISPFSLILALLTISAYGNDQNDHLSPFVEALSLPQDVLNYPLADLTPMPAPPAPTTPPDLNLFHLKHRQASTGCPASYSACANLGAPGLCCASNQICTPDQAGYVACCPVGDTCTGTITGVITAGTITAGGNAATTATATTAFGVASGTTTTNANGLVQASVSATTGTSNGGFILDGTSTVASPAAGARAVDTSRWVQFAVGMLGLLGAL